MTLTIIDSIPVDLWMRALRDSNLDRFAKTVGFTIATHWENGGEPVSVSIEEISRGASLRTPTVHGAIHNLELAGFLRPRPYGNVLLRPSLPSPEPFNRGDLIEARRNRGGSNL